MKLAKHASWILLFLVVGVLTRWPMVPGNFSAFIAIAIFAGFVLPAPLALVTTIGTMLIGDTLLGFHDLMWVVYLSLLPMVFVGSKMPKMNRKTWWHWGLAGFLASVFFFVTTNTAVWWTSGMYPLTQQGLVECFVLAIPFFHNSVLATWLFLAGFEGTRRLFPARLPVAA